MRARSTARGGAADAPSAASSASASTVAAPAPRAASRGARDAPKAAPDAPASAAAPAPARFEGYVFPALVALIAATRFYRIAEPAGIVFDELHFGKFVMWQMNRWFYL
jgi:hypothetical protein